MKAVMLAAGVGARLYGDPGGQPPKCLLRFEGRSLLARHVDILRARGIEELVLVVGYRADDLRAELRSVGAADFVRTLENPEYRRGSLVSLWTAREALGAGEPLLCMDADLLYHPGLVDRLLAEPGDAILLDRIFELGDEPVRLCLREGAVVDFRKAADVEHDEVGEWPGFLRLAPGTAGELAAVCERRMREGRHDEPCEEAIRELLLADPRRFRIADVTDLPWIEIDFPEDVERAEKEILPRLPTG